MKFLLILGVVFIGFDSLSQFSRAVHTTELEGTSRPTILTRVNGELIFVTIKESKEDTIILTTAWIDEFGETSDYKTDTVLGLSGEKFSLSGYAINPSNELVLAIISQGVASNNLHSIKYDVGSGNVLSSFTYPLSYSGGYVRSRQNGANLVCYLPMPSTGLTRVSMSITDPVNHTTSVISTGQSYNNQVLTSKKRVELTIDINGNEFISIDNKLIRRTITSVVSMTTVPFLASIASTALALNPQDEILFFNGSNYALLNATTLSLIDSSSILGTIGSSDRYTEVYFRDNNWCLYLKPPGNGPTRKIVFDATMNAISDFSFNENRFLAFDIYTEGNTGYVYGSSLDYTGYSVAIIKDVDLLSPGIFYEYNREIKHNNIQFFAGHLNSIFLNNTYLTSGLNMKHEGVYKSVLFNATNSLIGLNVIGDTVGVLTTYGGSYEYQEMLPGPYTPEALRSIENIDRYNRGLYIDKTMVDDHIYNISNGVPNYDLPLAIKIWPAHGDPALNQEANIAPFEDENGNGIYEPLLGDYPAFYGDRCVLNIFHRQDGEGNVGNCTEEIECLQYIYVFDCDTNEALMNTVFVNQKFTIYNNSLDDTWIGTFIDPDVGNYSDDYLGTNVELGMMYAHNGDNSDENSGGNIGFGNFLPAIGILNLRAGRLPLDGTDNVIGVQPMESVNGTGFGDGIIDNEHYTLESSISESLGGWYFPQSELLYSVFQGKNSNGIFPQVNGVDVRYSYFGDSDPQYYASWGINHGNNWSEITEANPPGDRRIIGGSGPVHLDASNPSKNSIEIATAYIISIDTINPATSPTDPLVKLFEFGAQLKSMYALNDAGCGGKFTPALLELEEQQLEARIYPNPATSEIYIELLKENIEALIITDASGRIIMNSQVNSKVVNIDVSTFQQGIYFVKIQAKTGFVTKKFLKQ